MRGRSSTGVGAAESAAVGRLTGAMGRVARLPAGCSERRTGVGVIGAAGDGFRSGPGAETFGEDAAGATGARTGEDALAFFAGPDAGATGVETGEVELAKTAGLSRGISISGGGGIGICVQGASASATAAGVW